jgi:hypothetical protein
VSLRVAPNDPTLAHVVARAGIEALADRSAALYERLHGQSVKDVARILRRHFCDLVLIEDIGRAIGSRANAVWVVLDADRDGEGLVPMRVVVRYAHGFGGLTVTEYRLRITAHTVARVLQRTLGHGDIKAAGPMLLHHLAQAVEQFEAGTLRRSDQVRTASPEGALLWESRNVDGKLILRGQTWIAADNADDEQLRADCATWATSVQRRNVQSGRAKPAGA